MKKEKVLTPEEISRKETMRSRCFWVFVGLDILLLITFVIQILVIVIPH